MSEQIITNSDLVEEVSTEQQQEISGGQFFGGYGGLGGLGGYGGYGRLI
jgi:hypothetical protein